MAAEKDQEFIESIVKSLVENPDGVKLNRTVDEMGVLIELTVDKEDMGVIIGKEGRTAKALRTLLRVLGAKNDARVNLKIVDPEDGGSKEKEKEPKAEPDSSEKEVKEEKKEDSPADNDEDKKSEDDERPMADLEL